MENAVVADADVVMKADYLTMYTTRLISPLMTVPCQMATLFPKNTSPTTVAVGATKTNPGILTLKS